MDWIWAAIGLVFVVWLVLVTLFTPRIDYHVTTPFRPDSQDFLHVIQATCDAAFHYDNAVHIFANGAQFYPAMRDRHPTCPAVRQSRPTSSSQARLPICSSTPWSSVPPPAWRCWILERQQ